MHLQSSKLLRLTINGEIHLQESILLTFDLGSRSHEMLPLYPLHHVAYAPAKSK